MTPTRTGPEIRRAALYVRVSTDEQAERGYSLRDQQARLETWCAREGIDVAGVWVEDGASAKTFERPQWSRLLAAIEAGRTSPVDAVLVVKWDRFSRDATGALGMIRRLDTRGVVVQAIEQPIVASVPEQLLMQVLYVAAPEVENRRRSLATKAGMRRAMKEGRWMNAPPKGYRRGRDAQDRYLLVPSDDAPLVRRAFELASDAGRSMESIRLELRKAGLRISKMQFTRLLRSAVYAGRIVVPAWGGEPATVVDGVHEPLVEAALFDRIQRDRFGAPDPRGGGRRRLVPELPLRGHLRCPQTGARLTGSRSKSATGAHVWYYHGQGRGAWRVRADAAHAAFGTYLGGIRLAPAVADLLRAMAEERSAETRERRRREAARAKIKLAEAEEKLLAVDTRWLDGEMDTESRDRLTTHYRSQRDAARLALTEASVADAERAEHVRFAADVLERLPEVWGAASVETRDALARSIWPSGVTYDGARYRTDGGDDLIGLLVGVRAENGDARASGEGGRLMWRPGRDLNSRPPA